MRQYSRKIYLISGMGALAFVAITAIPHAPVLVWNISASAPLGFYMRIPEGRPARNDLVLIRPPATIAEFAARRGYLPMNVPFINRIVAGTHKRRCAGLTNSGISARVSSSSSFSSQVSPSAKTAYGLSKFFEKFFVGFRVHSSREPVVWA